MVKLAVTRGGATVLLFQANPNRQDLSQRCLAFWDREIPAATLAGRPDRKKLLSNLPFPNFWHIGILLR